MLFLRTLAVRRRQPELMDDSDLDGEAHGRALQGLERINWWSGSARILWKPLARLARIHPGPLRVLDIATGAGDVPIRLWLKAKRAGIDLQIAGCDVSERALSFARQRAAARGADVQFFPLDAVHDELPAGYDVILSSLFLHHLDEVDAVGLLGKMSQSANRCVLINDLVRSARNYVSAYCVARLLTTSRIVHVDGPLSIEGAYTIAEIEALARRAGMAGSHVAKRWPCRFLLEWRCVAGGAR